jgi:hypothetical protein
MHTNFNIRDKPNGHLHFLKSAIIANKLLGIIQLTGIRKITDILVQDSLAR